MYSCSVLSRYENQITILSDYLEEFPETDEPVWILGRQHHLNTGIFRMGIICKIYRAFIDSHAAAASDFLTFSKCLMRVYFSPPTKANYKQQYASCNRTGSLPMYFLP